MIFNKYSKEASYSYVFGAFGTIELLKNKANECLAVLVDPSFTSNDAYKIIVDICKKKNIPIHVDIKLISKIKDKGNIFVIGVFKKYKNNLDDNNHLVIYKNNDVGSIGTIIRSMRGFNFSNLVLIDCDIDLYHEHLIRSTMGAFFQCNIKEYKSLADYINEYPNKSLINISNKGNSLSSILDKDNLSIIFSKESIDNNKITNILFDEDLPLENIVNIVLFSLYKD